MSTNPVAEMARRWLGIGNVDGKYWFCGIEPGGDHDPSWAERWYNALGSPEITDARQAAFASADSKWFEPIAPLQRTWLGQIRTVLAFEGRPDDNPACRQYQVHEFGKADGDILSVELSAYPARNMFVNVPRHEFVEERIKRIRELLLDLKPAFLVCYGVTRRAQYERIAGGCFDIDGFRWEGDTLCAITTHPTAQPPPSANYWLNLGLELRRRIEARKAPDKSGSEKSQ